MFLFDRLAEFLGYSKKSQQPSKRNFTAAGHNRLTSSWKSVQASADLAIYKDLKTLRGRSRELAMNNDYVKRFLNLCKNNIIGWQGITLQCKAKDSNGKLDKLGNSEIESAFKRWAKKGNCDVTGRLSWIEFQRLFIDTVAKDGEVIVRKVKNFDNDFGFALQIIDPDLLDENLNRDLGNGRRIRMGIELDEWGRPQAFYLLKQHPNDLSPYSTYQYTDKYQRIPASEIIHAFDPLRPSQNRGIPWAHAAMFRLHMLGCYEEAELVAARTGASKMGFFERAEDGEGYQGDEYDSDGNIISEAEPGTFEQLPPGVKLHEWDPQHPAGNFGNFVKAILRGIASGLGVTYHNLANDLEGVNFSSIRSGTLEERDCWMTLQLWVIENLHEQVFPDWLEMAMLHGQVNLPFSKFDKFNTASWQPRRWPWVDPLKDQEATLLSAKMGARSLADIIREAGRDPDDVFDEIAETKQKLEKLGLQGVLGFLFSTKEAKITANDGKSKNE